MIVPQNADEVRLSHTPTRQVIKTVMTVFISVVSIVCAVVGVYVAIDQLLSRPLVKMSVIDSQCLTKVETVSNLVAKFCFNGREVKNLWISRMRFVNDCRRNIIGLPGRDLMWSNLVISISHDYNVLSVELEASDFDVTTGTSDNVISLSFVKWKPNQFCVLKVYSEGLSDVTDRPPPDFVSEDEPFTQGDLIISGYHEECPESSVLRRLPYGLYAVLKWMGIVVFWIIIFVCIFVISGNWINLILRRRWDGIYGNEVQKILKARTSSNEGGGDIDLLGNDFWMKYHIPKPPRQSSYVVRGRFSKGEVISEHIVLGFLMLIASIALMSLIYV